MKILLFFVCVTLLISCEKKEQGYCYRCSFYGYTNGSPTTETYKDTCSLTPLPEYNVMQNSQGNDMAVRCRLK